MEVDVGREDGSDGGGKVGLNHLDYHHRKMTRVVG
jgi:hypothetical protein